MLETKRFVISKQLLYWTISLMVFFPFTFSNMAIKSELTTIVEVLKIMSFLLFLHSYKLNKSDFSPLITILLIYQISYLIPAIVYGNISLRTFYLWVKNTFTNVAFALILQRYLQINYKRALNSFYHAISVVLIFHSLIATFSDILLIGIRTRFTDFFIPALTLLAVISRSKMKKIKFWDVLFVLASVYFIINQAISTSIVILLVFCLAMGLENTPLIRFFINRICRYASMVCTALALNVAIVVFRIQNIFAFLIEDVLHESLTLTGRTTIWDQTFVELLKHNVLLGAGIQPEGSKDIHFNLYNQWGDNLLTDRQAHNQLLSVFFFNGIVGLISYTMMIFVAGSNLKHVKSKQVIFYYTLGIFLICISMITELSADGVLFFGILMCVFYGHLINDTIGESK